MILLILLMLFYLHNQSQSDRLWSGVGVGVESPGVGVGVETLRVGVGVETPVGDGSGSRS